MITIHKKGEKDLHFPRRGSKVLYNMGSQDNDNIYPTHNLAIRRQSDIFVLKLERKENIDTRVNHWVNQWLLTCDYTVGN